MTTQQPDDLTELLGLILVSVVVGNMLAGSVGIFIMVFLVVVLYMVVPKQ